MGKSAFWTEAEDQIVLDWAQAGRLLPRNTLAKRIGRTLKSLNSRIRTLGLSERPRRAEVWLQCEDDLLREWCDGRHVEPLSALAQRLERHPRSLHARVHLLGLTPPAGATSPPVVPPRPAPADPADTTIAVLAHWDRATRAQSPTPDHDTRDQSWRHT
jgi:hypothetical protein